MMIAMFSIYIIHAKKITDSSNVLMKVHPVQDPNKLIT